MIPGSGRSSVEGIGYPLVFLGFPGGSDGKESACNVEDLGSVPGFGSFPLEGNGNPLQCSINIGAWRAIVHGIAKSQT